MAEDGTFDVLPKKEVIALKKEWEKLREEPWRYQGDEEAPGCNLRCRPEEGENLRSGGSYTGNYR